MWFGFIICSILALNFLISIIKQLGIK
jgi:hypothetical protein